MLLTTHESSSIDAAHTETLADLLRRLGDVPAARVLLDPPPGLATEENTSSRREPAGWIVDPRRRTIEDWTSLTTMQVLGKDDIVDVGEILPGLTIRISDWFSGMDQLIDNQSDAAGLE